MTDGSGVLGKWLRRIGWGCLLGSSLVLVDLLALLPTMPPAWWGPPRPTQFDGSWDLRVMSVDLGFGWLGSPGYVIAFLWLPVASLRVVRAIVSGFVPSQGEWWIVMLTATELITISALVHLTPLQYASYNVPLL